MSTSRFISGSRFRWRKQTFDIKRLLPGNKANIENLESEALQTVDLDELHKELFAEELVFTLNSIKGCEGDQPAPLFELTDYPEHLVKIARYRLAVIGPLVDQYGISLTEDDVRARFDEVKEQEQLEPERSSIILMGALSISSIYRWLRDYSEAGRDLRSLIPDTRERGGKGISRLQPEVEMIIESTINDLYYKREKVTIRDIELETAVRIEEENKLRDRSSKLVAPSRATIVRRVDALEIQHVFRERRGKRAMEREFAQFGRMEYPENPLEEVQIDATKVDLIVIDEIDNLPLGRPTLMIAMDLATRYPTGFYLGFEPEGYLPLLETMWQMIIPKTGFREKYDLENEWLASGIPQTLSLDNSKAFRSKSLQDACQSLGIGIKHGRPRAPHLRGAIERQFRSLNSLFHAVPGTTFSNVVARADYPSEKLAVVSLQDLIRMLVIQLVDLYAESHHSGLGNIPARRWEAALEGGFIPRVPSDVRELRIILGRLDFRTVQHYGIDLNSIRYNSQDLAPLRTMIKKYPTQFGKEVKLKYHPGDLSHVYVFDPFQEIYIEVPAIDQEYTQQLSLWKHRIIKRYARAKEDREDPVSLGIAKRKLMNIVDEARSQKKIGTRARIGRFDRAGQTPSLQELPKSRSMTKKPIEEKSISSMDSDFKQPVRDISDPLDEAVDEGWSIGIAKA